MAVVDLAPARLALARDLGADAVLTAAEATPEATAALSGGGFEVVADVTGVPAVIAQTFAHVRPRGKVWIFGVAPDGASVPFSPYEVFRKDLSVIGSFALSKTFPESLALLRSGAIRAAPLVSHVLPLERFAEGLHLAEHDPDRMKVQFSFE